MTEAVYILDAVHTPVGKIGGDLAAVRPDDLAAGVVKCVHFVDVKFEDAARQQTENSELHEVAGGEALGLDADCADAVGAVAADMSSVVHDEDQQIPSL